MIADCFSSAGFAVELLAHSEYHQKFEMVTFLDIDVLAPRWCAQAHFYLSNDGVPTAKTTWTYLSEDAQTDIQTKGRALAESEWTCGSRLFLNDWIVPYGYTRDFLEGTMHNVFQIEFSTSVRRNPGTTVWRINRCIWINLRKSQYKNTAFEVAENVKCGEKAHLLPKPKRLAQHSSLKNPAGGNPAQQEKSSNEL